MKVYFISGLAADRRVFKNIHLPVGYVPAYLDWIPARKNESLESYACRLAENIDTSEKFAVIGLSMGGMIAAEIAKKYKPVTTILLSSVSSHQQFPVRLKLAYHARLHKLVPVNFLKSVSFIKRLFTSERPEDKKVLQQIIKDSDPDFIRWAVGAILKWRNEEIPNNLWHIHGSKDEVLPIKNTQPTHVISRGTHLMVMSRAHELNKLLKELLDSATAVQKKGH